MRIIGFVIVAMAWGFILGATREIWLDVWRARKGAARTTRTVASRARTRGWSPSDAKADGDDSPANGGRA